MIVLHCNGKDITLEEKEVETFDNGIYLNSVNYRKFYIFLKTPLEKLQNTAIRLINEEFTIIQKDMHFYSIQNGELYLDYDFLFKNFDVKFIDKILFIKLRNKWFDFNGKQDFHYFCDEDGISISVELNLNAVIHRMYTNYSILLKKGNIHVSILQDPYCLAFWNGTLPIEIFLDYLKQHKLYEALL